MADNVEASVEGADDHEDETPQVQEEIIRRHTISQEKNETPLKEGWLVKQGGKFKSWKKRYFVLYKTGVVYFDQQNGKIKGGIAMETITAIRGAEPWETKKEHCFTIVCGKGRAYIQQAPTKAAKEDWMTTIAKSVSIEVTPTSTTTATTPLTSTPAMDVQSIVNMQQAQHTQKMQQQKTHQASQPQRAQGVDIQGLMSMMPQGGQPQRAQGVDIQGLMGMIPQGGQPQRAQGVDIQGLMGMMPQGGQPQRAQGVDIQGLMSMVPQGQPLGGQPTGLQGVQNMGVDLKNMMASMGGTTGGTPSQLPTPNATTSQSHNQVAPKQVALKQVVQVTAKKVESTYVEGMISELPPPMTLEEYLTEFDTGLDKALLPTPPPMLSFLNQMDAENMDLIYMANLFSKTMKSPAIDAYIEELKKVPNLPRAPIDSTNGVITSGWKAVMRHKQAFMPQPHLKLIECQRLCYMWGQYKGGPGVGTKLAKILHDVGGVKIMACDLEYGQAPVLPAIATEMEFFYKVIDDVCGKEGEWDKFNDAVLILCSHFVSFVQPSWDNTVKPPVYITTSDGIVKLKAIVKKHIERIADVLVGVEAEMRKSGEYDILTKLVLAEPVDGVARPTRQDHPEVLGNNSDYLKFQHEFDKPGWTFGQSIDQDYLRESEKKQELWYSMSPDLTQMLDPVYRDYVEPIMGMMASTYDQVKLPRPAHLTNMDMSRVLNFQPYLLWLLSVAQKINKSFQKQVSHIVGDRYEGDPDKIKIKKLTRSNTKTNGDYREPGFKMPSSSHMLDIVRCLVKCKDANDAKAAYQAICSKFEVVRVKNGFAQETAAFGFRQILMNVVYRDVATGLSMICEIQINLEAWCNVKHKIHRLYSVVRSEEPSEIYHLVLKNVLSF